MPFYNSEFSDENFANSDSSGNKKPQFTGPLMFDLRFGEQINEQLTWVDDDSDEVRISIPEDVTAGYVTSSGRFIYHGDKFTANLALLEDLSRVEKRRNCVPKFFTKKSLNKTKLL